MGASSSVRRASESYNQPAVHCSQVVVVLETAVAMQKTAIAKYGDYRGKQLAQKRKYIKNLESIGSDFNSKKGKNELTVERQRLTDGDRVRINRQGWLALTLATCSGGGNSIPTTWQALTKNRQQLTSSSSRAVAHIWEATQ